MNRSVAYAISIAFLLWMSVANTLLFAQDDARLQPLPYNNPGLTVDLGVGLWAWPLPMDWDEDGDYDLVVSCPDKPFNGIYFFENLTGNVRFPLFAPPVRVGPGRKSLQVSHIDGEPRVLESNLEWTEFRGQQFDPKQRRKLLPNASIHPSKGNQRFNVWSLVDYDGDGATDILVGADDWGYYGWDDGYDLSGNWKKGPLHGYVYVLRNTGADESPNYDVPLRLQATTASGLQDINVYGNPMPNLADFDGDGDLDLICAEFLDGFTLFENTGSRTEPSFVSRGYLHDSEGAKIRMHVQMITPSAIDWDRDGDVDLIVGDEDGRVALVENVGVGSDLRTSFAQPRYFQQQARDLKFGALVTPVGVDWDQDGDVDLVCGNTSGNIAWFENLSGPRPLEGTPKWADAKLLEVEGEPIHIQAGDQGSIQGPAEAKWGYTTLSVADWDHDGLNDLVVNSIWGKVVWFRNVGTPGSPKLAQASPIVVAWEDSPPKPNWTWWTPANNELATQWRTTPVVNDWNCDGLNDLVMLDHEGYLACFSRSRAPDGTLRLLPGKRIFRGGWYDSKHREKPASNDLLRLNVSSHGGSGRRKLAIVDWDGDGNQDLLMNSTSVHWLQNKGNDEEVSMMIDRGPLTAHVLAGHTTSPTTVDWDQNGIPDLVIGAEDGRLYYLKNERNQD